MILLLLLPAVVVAVALSVIVTIVLLMHCIQRCYYCILDLILYAGAHTMDLHLNVVDGGLDVGQYRA